MRRIKERRYGRTGDTPLAMSATGRIKIGFDKKGTDLDHRKKGREHSLPGKLPGFLLCRDSIGPDGNLVVDDQAMKMLGVTASAIKAAKAKELKADPGILPTALRFVIINNAIATADGWTYPSTYGEEFECWSKGGLYCHGDGEKAMRKQGDGTRLEIECVPIGREGKEASEFCEYSGDKRCKPISRLVLCLYAIGEDGQTLPLDARLGSTGRWRFDTSSEYIAIGFVGMLDNAAARLKGNLSGLTGTLNYNIKSRRTGNEEHPVGRVGQVTMQLDEGEIQRREQLLHPQLETPEPVKQIEAAERSLEQQVKEWPEKACDKPPLGEVVVNPPPEEEDLPPEDPAEEADTPQDDYNSLSIEGKDDLLLAESLGQFIINRADAEARPVEEVTRAFLWLDRGGQRIVIESVGYFLKGDGEQAEMRIKALREICRRMFDNKVEGFKILTPTEAGLL